jgi:hypothetical protein
MTARGGKIIQMMARKIPMDKRNYLPKVDKK